MISSPLQHESRRDGPDRMPSLFAVESAVVQKNHVRVVEHAGRGFKVQAVVLRLVDSILSGIPFEAHRYTYCITMSQLRVVVPAVPRVASWV